MANVGAFMANVGAFMANVGEFMANVGAFMANVGAFMANVGEFMENGGQFMENGGPRGAVPAEYSGAEYSGSHRWLKRVGAQHAAPLQSLREPTGPTARTATPSPFVPA
jgi:hypothetical protein